MKLSTMPQILGKKFVDSFWELKNLHSLIGMAMLLALSLILDSLKITITPALTVGVGFLVTALLGMLYGPVAGGLAAGAGDIIKALVRPIGPFFIGYTINAMLGGVIYGLFFYKMKPSLPKVIISKTIINVFLNGLLSTYWSSLLYGKGFSTLFYPRMGKNLLALPLEVVLLFCTLTVVVKIIRKSKIQAV